MKKAIFLVSTLFLIVLTFLTYNETIQWQLLIHSPIYTDKVLLEERNQGFQGARIKYILQHPKNSNELIAKGSAGCYYTNNKGDSWRLLQIDDLKYRGGGDGPNVFWDNNGRMITSLYNSIYWSDNAIDWKGEWVNHNLRYCGINSAGEIWIERAVKGQEANVFEYISWNDSGEFTTKVITSPWEIKKIQQEDLNYLERELPSWKIETNKIFYRPDTTSNWNAKDKGIERPVILYFFQDTINPKQIVAVEGSEQLYSQSDLTPTLGYWASDDFGASWASTDSSIFSKWSLKNNIITTTACKLERREFDAYLEGKELETNFSFFGLTEDVGWLSKTQYYMLGDEGIQIGNVDKACQIEQQTLWSWNYHHWENDVRYHVSSLNKYEDYTKNRQYQRILFLKEGEKIKLLFPNNYGGLWYTEVSQNHPSNAKRYLHYFVQHQLVLLLWISFGIFLLFEYRRRQLK